MQGGIALTSPTCHKKTDQRSNGKSPVCLSNELRNGCRKGGVIKNKKTLTVNATLIIRKGMPRNTCIVDGTCSGIPLRIIRHLPLGSFYFFTTPPLRLPFRSSFDKQTGLFPLDRWSVFLWHGGLVKAILLCKSSFISFSSELNIFYFF